MKQESIFVEYFGDSPLVRIMNFLILGKDFDYSMTEIANGAGVGWTSFTRAWKILLKKNAVVPTRVIGRAKLFKLNTSDPTRVIGRAKLFKLNTSDPTIKKLLQLHWEIIKQETNKMLTKYHENPINPKGLIGFS